MKELLAENEMAVAGSPSEYHEMFEHFLHNSQERVAFIRNGMTRVYSEYTLFHVLGRLAEHLGLEAETSKNSENVRVSTSCF